MKRESVRIRQARVTDIDKIIEFIKRYYYIPNHVFTRNRELFNSWHVHNEEVWFVIGEGEESGQIYGILGYTLYTEMPQTDVSLAMFQTIKSGNPALGINLITYVHTLYPSALICSCGIVPNTRKMYEFLGYETGRLKHYYRIADRSNYKIAQINNKKIKPIEKRNDYYFYEIKDIEELKKKIDDKLFENAIPHKDYTYIEKKYFKNIGYQYIVLGLMTPSHKCVGILAGREIKCNGEKCFKIVDFIGDDKELANSANMIQDFIDKNQYEYIDFYETGIDDNVMQEAGFTWNDGKENIIPHYFEPYLLKNIDIYYCTSIPSKFHGYRSDGGQERPNYVEEWQEREKNDTYTKGIATNGKRDR